jgi:hypothetical protein
LSALVCYARCQASASPVSVDAWPTTLLAQHAGARTFEPNRPPAVTPEVGAVLCPLSDDGAEDCCCCWPDSEEGEPLPLPTPPASAPPASEEAAPVPFCGAGGESCQPPLGRGGA